MKLKSRFNRRRWEGQMDAEFQFHLEAQINCYVEQGLSRKDAEVRARLVERIHHIPGVEAADITANVALS